MTAGLSAFILKGIMRHGYDEFKLSLRWAPSINGVTPASPGFYLNVGFYNEGEVAGVVKGSWDNGRYGPGSLVPAEFIEELMALIEHYDMLVPGENGHELGATLANFQRNRQAEALEAKLCRLARLKAEVEALERELS